MKTIKDKLLDRIKKTNTCWVWKGNVSQQGYGRICVLGRYRRAHRIAYEILIGPIPKGLTLDHLCRNRRCVNPEHLEPVSSGVNVLRGESIQAKNARKTHCIRGHKFTPANTRISVSNGYSHRQCRTCTKLKSQS